MDQDRRFPKMDKNGGFMRVSILRIRVNLRINNQPVWETVSTQRWQDFMIFHDWRLCQSNILGAISTSLREAVHSWNPIGTGVPPVKSAVINTLAMRRRTKLSSLAHWGDPENMAGWTHLGHFSPFIEVFFPLRSPLSGIEQEITQQAEARLLISEVMTLLPFSCCDLVDIQ